MRANCSVHLSEIADNCSEVTKLAGGAEDDGGGEEGCVTGYEDCGD